MMPAGEVPGLRKRTQGWRYGGAAAGLVQAGGAHSHETGFALPGRRGR
jgi:hypothetical protein